jgi:hypothetical protein
MNEGDSLQALLREWEAAQPESHMDRRVLDAYRGAIRNLPWWRRFWRARISIPVPVILAAAALIALFLWLRPARPVVTDATTEWNVTGFQPLPNGAARVIRAREGRK